MSLRCTYCPHEYPALNKPQDEFTKEVMRHVQSAHQDKWKMVRPGDNWVIQTKDK